MQPDDVIQLFATLSHDFLLRFATIALMRLARKLKCVISTRSVHMHCNATSASSLLAIYPVVVSGCL